MIKGPDIRLSGIDIPATPPADLDILAICRKVKEMVDYNMVWTEDKVVFGVDEYWVSHADWILKHNNEQSQIRDDCDGFAISSADLCLHYGIPANLIRVCFVIVPDENGQFTDAGGHCICVVDDPKRQDSWSLDNCQDRVVSWSTEGYQFLQGLRLSEKDTVGWRQIISY